MERHNHVIKERARAIIQMLPYTTMPKWMRGALINYVVYWLNCMQKEGQYSSPREMIMGGPKLEYKKMCRLLFGAYVQVHNNNLVINTMESRTTGAVNLGPTVNTQGGHWFLNLTTGNVVTRRSWMKLPIPTEVILRLEELLDDPNDTVSDMYEQEIKDEENDNGDIQNETEDDGDYADVPTLREQEKDEQIRIPDISDATDVMTDVILENHEERDENPLDVLATAETVVTSNHDYNLRKNRTRDYSHRFSFLSVASSIKKWGDKAIQAVREELQMLLDEKVFRWVKKPSREQVDKALRIHRFVVEKRNRRVKARTVADGRTQKRYLEEETYSPTVRLKGIMLNSLVNAHEGREVVTIDIKEAFLKAKVPDEMELIIRMDGDLAILFCELHPEFQLDEKGVIYLKCVKALYGHIEAARLFYDDLDYTLTHKMGFVQNAYDPCVYNTRTSDGAVTIRTHVDDVKASSRASHQLEKVIQDFRQIYGEMTVHRGEEHDYLGMLFRYNKNQKTVSIDMRKYINGCIEEFQEAVSDIKWKEIATPTTENWFKV